MSEQPENNRRIKQIRLWAAAIFIGVSITFLAYVLNNLIFVEQGKFIFSDRVTLPLTILMVIASIVSYWLIRKDHPAAGTTLLFLFDVIIPPILFVVVIKGVIVISSLYLVMMSIIMISQLLQVRSKWPAIATAVAALLISLGIEFIWNPPFRLETPAAVFLMIVSIVAGLALLAYITWLAWQGNIRVKLMTSFALISLAIVLTLSTIAYFTLRNQVLADSRQRLLNMVSIAALQQDGDLHNSLISKADQASDAYAQIKKTNTSITATDPNIAYLYTMRDAPNNQIYYLVDSGQPGDEDTAQLLELYIDASPQLIQAFPTINQPFALDEYYTDEFGTFLSAYAPFYDSNGQRAGVVGMDIRSDYIIQKQQGFLLTLSIISVLIMLVTLLVSYFLSTLFTRPILNLANVAQKITAGDLSARARVTTPDEVGALANVFNNMTTQLSETLSGLEQRVAARTRDLATVAEVGTATSAILETDRLLQAVVDLTKERFNLYHSHIYLLDEAGQNLVLAAGAGEAGQIMVAEKRSIPLNREQSLVARAARERKGITVNDVTLAPDFLPNPLLPETRAELAVPMIVGAQLIGVFDIQSEQVGRFAESDINIQTTLAAQVATSVQNVRSFERTKAQADIDALTSSISAKIQRTVSVEDALQTAIREIGQALNASRVSAKITPSRQDEVKASGLTEAKNVASTGI